MYAIRSYYDISAEWMKFIFEKYCGYDLIVGYDINFGTGSSRYENMEKTIKYGYVLIKDIHQQLKSGLKGLSKLQLVRNTNGIVTVITSYSIHYTKLYEV